RQRFGGELQSHWTRLSRQSHPQHKLAAWWCERVARRQILIRWQLPTVVRTEFSQFPPPLPPMCRRTQPEPARASPVTGVCGFPVINLTHPTERTDGQGLDDANVESVRVTIQWKSCPQDSPGMIGAGLVQTTGVEREQTRLSNTQKLDQINQNSTVTKSCACD